MNKHIFLGIISVRETIVTKVGSQVIRNLMKLWVKKVSWEEKLPVNEAISISHIEPLHCALNQGGYSNRKKMI